MPAADPRQCAACGHDRGIHVPTCSHMYPDCTCAVFIAGSAPADPREPQEPTTEAGREYIGAVSADTWSREGRVQWARTFVLAIEAEAGAARAEGRPEDLPGLRELVASFVSEIPMPWYDEANPDFTEAIDFIVDELRGAEGRPPETRMQEALAEAHWALVMWVNRDDDAFLSLLDRIEPLVTPEAALRADARMSEAPTAPEPAEGTR